MIIQNSPFYKPIQPSKVVNQTNKDFPIANQQKPEDLNEEGFSFWKWFKGLVNPLQNLPLISGIYSSVNAEDENSDRDLVQNSLGGFLYGGPIGAIAGFGNWVFNKIFDKTPTELALDASGISNIWKDEDQKKENVIAKSEPKIITGNEKKLHMQLTSSNDFFNNSQKNNKNLASLQNSINLQSETKKDIILQKENPTNQLIISQKSVGTDVRKDLANLQNSINSQSELKKDIILPKENSTNKLIISQKPVETEIRNEFQKSTNEKAFREINFTYPTWKPESLEIIGKKDLKNSKVKYMDLEDKQSNKSLYNIDA